MPMFPRTALALALTLAALAVAACGDEEQDQPADAGTATTEPTQTTAPTEPAQEAAPTNTGTGQADGPGGSGGAQAPAGSPEDQPGGAGDEVPASSQALITGRGGELHPTVVRVPPYIAVRVVLTSADGIEYELSARGRTVAAGGEIRSASTLFPGLRPGQRLVLAGPQGEVAIEPNAEPGP